MQTRFCNPMMLGRTAGSMQQGQQGQFGAPDGTAIMGRTAQIPPPAGTNPASLPSGQGFQGMQFDQRSEIPVSRIEHEMGNVIQSVLSDLQMDNQIIPMIGSRSVPGFRLATHANNSMIPQMGMQSHGTVKTSEGRINIVTSFL
ncbi:hypothetical protein ACJMK2_040350 [Sinanodonta woodiana]|uniref:Uncharacterized protein n=1 Tax=Sinanodonta woodiana TaxID=1069815 RepID=A0ABD3WI51_SINWO